MINIQYLTTCQHEILRVAELINQKISIDLQKSLLANTKIYWHQK